MKTLAVVIGNNNYYGSDKLDNAVNDARAIADVFSRLGYEVLFKEDCSVNDCVSLLTEFDTKLQDFDSSIFFFAGHGFQLDGENYLASIECQVANPNKYHCSKTCITLTEVLGIFKKNTNKTHIVIIDACRKSFERGSFNSFTPIQAPKGTLIAFSTSPNEGAKDNGFDGHSIYTGALLNYIGREWISVEELFKKVRKTVYNLTEGKQTTWEHTSLIGDFYFNTGQLVYSLSIPYDEFVIKDKDFKDAGDLFSSIILDLKSSNWHRQNPAIEKFLKIQPNELNKNQQFLIGRNLLQANGYANNASSFFANLNQNLKRYSRDGENHILNGILFEMYFDSNGDFRRDKFKNHNFEQTFQLRLAPAFKKSFELLQYILAPYNDILFYIPSDKQSIIDIDIIANEVTTKDFLGIEEVFQVISKINIATKDITKSISKYGIHGQNRLALEKALSNFLFAPSELIKIHSNIELSKIAFRKFEDEDEFPF